MAARDHAFSEQHPSGKGLTFPALRWPILLRCLSLLRDFPALVRTVLPGDVLHVWLLPPLFFWQKTNEKIEFRVIFTQYRKSSLVFNLALLSNELLLNLRIKFCE